MKKPLISVVVCTFNRRDILLGALKSLVEQSADKADYEVVVVDNNSTDETEYVARGFEDVFENFIYVNETNQGLSHSRNRGYQVATASFVAYMDDDAKADTNWIKSILGFIKSNPDVQAFGGPYDGFSYINIPKWFDKRYGSWSLGDVEREIKEDEWINGTNMVYTKSLLTEIGGFDTRVGMSGKTVSYGEEVKLQIQVKERGIPIFYVPGMRVRHMIASYKMSFSWMLKSHYRNGFSALEAHNLKRNLFFQVILTLYLCIKGIFVSIFSGERVFKSRILQGFAPFTWNLGFLVKMIKG
jgi:glycosyltransferase involved in cell wall biosynthesis